MALMQCLAIDILVTKFRFSRKNALTLKKKVLATVPLLNRKGKSRPLDLISHETSWIFDFLFQKYIFKKKTKNINILSVELKLEGATCSSPQRRTWSSAFDFTLTPPVEKLLLFRGSAARGRIGTAFITFLVLEKNHLVPQKTEISVICCRRKEANKFSQRLHGRKKNEYRTGSWLNFNDLPLNDHRTKSLASQWISAYLGLLCGGSEYRNKFMKFRRFKVEYSCCWYYKQRNVRIEYLPR